MVIIIMVTNWLANVYSTCMQYAFKHILLSYSKSVFTMPVQRMLLALHSATNSDTHNIVYKQNTKQWLLLEVAEVCLCIAVNTSLMLYHYHSILIK